MLPGPVFNAELLTLGRRARYYLLRAAYGSLLLFFIWMTLPWGYDGSQSPTGEVSIQRAAQIGASLFSTFMIVQSIAVIVLTPALIAGAIADERQRKTLHYLLASRLSSAEIVLGKLFARGLLLGVFLALGLPILVMISLFGGVDPNMVLLLFAGSSTSAFFLAGLSILASTQAKRPREAVSISYIGTLAWLFGPSLYEALPPDPTSLFRSAHDALLPAVEFLGGSSPFYVFSRMVFRGFGGASAGPIVQMMALQVGFGLLFCLWATLRIRPNFRREGARRSLAGVRQLWGFRFFRRPECGDDAMLWKERHISKSSPLMRLLTGIVVVIMLGFLAFGCSYFVPDAAEEFWQNGYTDIGAYNKRSELNGFLRVVLTLLGICVVMGTASAASATLTGEREEDTWISLISTPLTAEEIVRAKWFGAAWSLRMAVLVWGGLLLMGLALGAIHPLGGVTAVMFLATYTAFACALGVFYSLLTRTSSRALLATVGTLLFTNVGYLLLAIPLMRGPGGPSLIFVGVGPMFLALSPMSYRDLGSNISIGGDDGTLLVNGIFSLILYGLGALVLGAVTLQMFDDLNDRPRGGGGRSKSAVEPGDETLDDEASPTEIAAVDVPGTPAGEEVAEPKG